MSKIEDKLFYPLFCRLMKKWLQSSNLNMLGRLLNNIGYGRF